MTNLIVMVVPLRGSWDGNNLSSLIVILAVNYQLKKKKGKSYGGISILFNEWEVWG